MSTFIDFGTAKKLKDMQAKNRITELFNIQYPIIQGGMVWHSGWRLASAYPNAGGLGLIGAGRYVPRCSEGNTYSKCKQLPTAHLAVNIPTVLPPIWKISSTPHFGRRCEGGIYLR
ncbi:nitronate monooxygenase [Bergeyella porcorum]|uniref:nitronate monooxygenase n=1 Tax=Bergeyella porcorum TaxID=1735111 RepID=UPI002E24EEC3